VLAADDEVGLSMATRRCRPVLRRVYRRRVRVHLSATIADSMTTMKAAIDRVWTERFE
jgi:hypothetical protein